MSQLDYSDKFRRILRVGRDVMDGGDAMSYIHMDAGMARAVRPIMVPIRDISIALLDLNTATARLISDPAIVAASP